MFTIPKFDRICWYGPEMINVEAAPILPEEYELLPALREYMIRIMNKYHGCGLAAPQVGIFKQFCVIMRAPKYRGADPEIIDMVNPEITKMYGIEEEDFEACLSIPPDGNGTEVARCRTVHIAYATSAAPTEFQEERWDGWDSRVAQHEIDHLTGTFFIDRVKTARRDDVLKAFEKWKRKQEKLRCKEPVQISRRSSMPSASAIPAVR